MALLLAVIGIWRRHAAFAALCFALACQQKIYPALLGLLFPRQRRWPLLWWTASAALALVALSTVGYGFAPYLRLVGRLFEKSALPAEAEFNISLYGFWARLYTALHTRWGVLLLAPAYGLVLAFCQRLASNSHRAIACRQLIRREHADTLIVPQRQRPRRKAGAE